MVENLLSIANNQVYIQLMRKIATLIGIIGLTLSLTSCVKLDMSLEVNKDSTVSGTMIFALVDSLAEMGDTSKENDSPTDSFVNPTAKGVTVSDYKQGGYTGQKFTLDHVPFSEFGNGEGADSDFKIKRAGNRITVSGFLDLSSGDTGDSGSEWGDALAKSILSSADLRISIKFPAKVVASTGEISEDKQSVTWRPKMGEKVDLTTTVEIPSLKVGLLVGAAASLMAIVGGVAFLISRRKKQESNIAFESDSTTS
jgi:hypothetical protein